MAAGGRAPPLPPVSGSLADLLVDGDPDAPMVLEGAATLTRAELRGAPQTARVHALRGRWARPR